ncbi:MAG: hypothetical protein K0Q55_873 [Verrucomicrobia bacterium]|nr:hypothetical protein [Verrucomicrobiota bacterium]
MPTPQAKFFTRKRWLIASASVVLVMLAVWLAVKPQRYHITDVARPQAIVLQAPTDEKQRWVDISVRITGKIDGKATIHSPFRGSSLEVKDSFDIDLGVMDCYSPQHPTEYVPHGVTNGWITIHYKFYDLSMMGELQREVARKRKSR